jgi:hypothetical protein
MTINVTGFKLVYWSYKALLKLILWGIGPPLLWDQMHISDCIYQSDICKLGAATANTNLTSHSGSSVVKGLQACVQHSFALLAGSINSSKNRMIFDISCSNCNLTSCVDNYIHGSLLRVKQSPYILVPTNFMGP